MKILILLFSNLFVFALIVISSMVIIPINIVRKLYREDSVEDYLLSLLLAQDQVFGTTLYATEDFTTSSWTHKLAKHGNKYAVVFEIFINKLAYLVAYLLYKLGFIGYLTLIKQDQHCKHSYENELAELKNIKG